MILLSIICVNEKSVGRNNISSIGCCPIHEKENRSQCKLLKLSAIDKNVAKFAV